MRQHATPAVLRGVATHHRPSHSMWLWRDGCTHPRVSRDERHRPCLRPPCWQAGAALALLLGSGACSSDVTRSVEEPAPRIASVRYALDGLQRRASGGKCPKVALSEFAGQSLRFSPAARVAPAFRARLLQLEQVVREVALRIYDRVPSAILVAASYDCRLVNRSQGRLSEHAFGNAIDIAGFRFPPVEASFTRSSEEGFDVRVDQHWKARGGALERRHARFLEELTRTLIQRDVFRTLLGPAHPDHHDHFHFDMAPGHFVDL